MRRQSGNRRRTEGRILVFSKGTIQRAGEDFNQSEFLVPIELLQTVHLSVGLVNTYVAAGVGEVGVPGGGGVGEGRGGLVVTASYLDLTNTMRPRDAIHLG